MASPGDFHWQLDSPIVVLDNGPWLASQPRFAEYLEWGSFQVISFDPGMRLQRDSLPASERFQLFPLAMLGDGSTGQVNVCLDPAWSASLNPLDADALAEGCQAASQVMTRMPVSPICLDAIDGLPRLDWLVLGAGHDALAILAQGSRALADTLLLQVELYFQPVHAGQPGFEAVAAWARQHGFRFHGFAGVQHLPPELPKDYQPCEQGTAWLKASALFVPDRARMARLDAAQLTRLAFLFDAIFDAPAASFALLLQADPQLAHRYGQARLPRAERALPGELQGWSAAEALPEQPLPAQIRARALACLARGSVQGARYWSLKWLAQEPDQREALHCLAEAQSCAGQHSDALALLQRLQRQYPGDAPLAASLAWACWRAGQLKGARKALETLPQEAVDSLAYLQARLLVASAKPREQRAALQLCRSALEDNTQDAHWLALQAQLLAHTDPAAARDSAEAATVRLDDSDLELYGLALLDLSEAWQHLGQADAALQAVLRLCARQPVSLASARAQTRLPELLAQSVQAAERDLGDWLRPVWSAWRQAGRGHCGLPEQSLPTLRLAGCRDTAVRLAAYDLAGLLPPEARVLDIRSQNGALLIDLARQVPLAVAIGLTEHPADQALAQACAARLELANLRFVSGTLNDHVSAAPFDLILACEALHVSGLHWEDFGERLLALCAPGGWVLLESHGVFDPEELEPGFAEMATAIASAGFEAVREICLCDDGISLRCAHLLRAPLTIPSCPEQG